MDKPNHVSKRAIASIIAGSVASAAGEQLSLALAGILKKLLPITEWDPAREAFTEEATLSLWNNNPDPAKWVAAVCYNQAWDVSNKAGISDVVSLKFSLGAFNTDYDCMYIGKGTQFFTQGDGGFINVSVLLISFLEPGLSLICSFVTNTTTKLANMILSAVIFLARRILGIDTGFCGWR